MTDFLISTEVRILITADDLPSPSPPPEKSEERGKCHFFPPFLTNYLVLKVSSCEDVKLRDLRLQSRSCHCSTQREVHARVQFILLCKLSEEKNELLF